jgi:hypothetical protein
MKYLLLLVAAAAATSLDVPSAAELQAQMNAAILQRKNEFIIPPGQYNFTTVSSTANFEISGAVSMRVVATGVAFLFSCVKSQAPALCPGVNIANCDGLNVSGLSIDYYNIPQASSAHRLGSTFNPGIPGITYNVLNSSDVISEDVTIHNAPYFVVTAFNGGGGHVFRRFHLPGNATHYNHGRDAFHFTDLRRGVVVEDSDGGHCGDDFFNSHNTVMLVLKQESPTSLLVINPHVIDMYTKYGKNTIYGANCVLETVRAGDQMSFFSFTNDKYIVKPLGSLPSAVKGSPQQVMDASTQPLSPRSSLSITLPSLLSPPATLLLLPTSLHQQPHLTGDGRIRNRRCESPRSVCAKEPQHCQFRPFGHMACAVYLPNSRASGAREPD